MWSRRKLGEAAQGLADQLLLAEQVKALQSAQKEITDSLGQLGDRLRKLEAEMTAMRAEVKLDAIKEAQTVIYAVQNGLAERIQEIAVKVAVNEVNARRLSGPNST